MREVVRQELLQEDLSSDEVREVRELIRQELSSIFYDLYKRRGFWVDRV